MARDRRGGSSRRARLLRQEKQEPPPEVPEKAGPADPKPKSRRSKAKGTKKKRKKIDVMPIVMVGILLAAGVAAVLYFPMQRRTLRKAVAGGDRLGFDAAYAVSSSPSAVGDLCAMIERNAPGRMAAAGALALIARRSAPEKVVGTIQTRLKEGLSAAAKEAYAAALAQSRTEAGENAASRLASDGNPSVRLAVVRGLAHGRSPVCTRVVGTALGDTEESVREAARDALTDWTVTSHEKAIAAASAGLQLEQETARVSAAEAMVAVAGRLRPSHVVTLLSDGSSRVRELGLEAVVMALGLLSSGDAALQEAMVNLLDVEGQPPGVKLAALKVVAANGLPSAGPRALDILKDDPDHGIRASAAAAVARTQPEGTWEALVAPLLQDDASRQLRISCLEAFQRMGPVPPDEFAVVTRAVLKHAAGEDRTLAGLGLLAMRWITGRHDVKYGLEQWKKYLARRAFETRVFEETKERFAELRKEYEAKPDDWERIKKAVDKAGLSLQDKAMENADAEDKKPMQKLIHEMVGFNRRMMKR